MHKHRTRTGETIFYATRAELEAASHYRPEAGGRRGRACCIAHGGDNPSALSISWETGWAECYTRGCRIRVTDHPDVHLPRELRSHDASVRRSMAPPRVDIPQHDLRDLHDRLRAMLDTWAAALPGSPGTAYLDRRGIPLNVANRLGIGWATTGPLAHRVVFPLTGPDGIPTSATGRAIDDRTMPKYRTLPSNDGYAKTLFNGGAIAQAKTSGEPLVIVEGHLDATACITGGLPLTVALGSVAYARPEHFAGVAGVILALDADEAGQAARRALAEELLIGGVGDVRSLPAAALAGCKDLGDYWQAHRALPPLLAALAAGTTPPADDAHQLDAMSWCDRWRVEAIRRYPHLRTPDLSFSLKAEALALAAELATAGQAEIAAFAGDLVGNEDTMTPEDRLAAWYALRAALDMLPAA